MGGHVGGQVASQLAVATIAEVIRAGHGPMNGDPDSLVTAIKSANGAVFSKAKADPSLHNMGTTVVAIRADGDLLHVCHVGDSRIYRLRQGTFEQVTRDHSLINLYADHPEMAGKLGPAHSNIIVRAVGLHEYVEVDHKIVEVEDGDVYLLCSDGLVDMAEDWMVREMLTSGESLEDTAATLVRAANTHGGADNISVIVVRVEHA
jgi:protein phosphatase